MEHKTIRCDRVASSVLALVTLGLLQTSLIRFDGRKTQGTQAIRQLQYHDRGRLHSTDSAQLGTLRDKPSLPTGGRAIIVLHFHKCAGGYLCELAHLATSNTSSPIAVSPTLQPLWRTCNLLGDGPATLHEGKGYGNSNWTCLDRAMYLTSIGSRVAFLERWFDPVTDMCPEHFVYLTVLRHPVRRIISHAEFHQQMPKLIRIWMTVDSHDSTLPLVKGSPVVDNYYVRTLNGRQVWETISLQTTGYRQLAGVKGLDLPLGGVGPEHLEQAKRVLSSLDVTLILEDLEQDWVLARERLGWDMMAAAAVAPNGTGGAFGYRHQAPKRRRFIWTEDFLALVEDNNKLDMELYTFAKGLVAERRRSVVTRQYYND